MSEQSLLRTRWSAIGAAVAITLGGGGIGIAQATLGAGERPVTVTTDSKRVLDTRTGLGLTGAFTTDAPRDVQITGPVEVATPTGSATETVVPAGASAVLVNVTVVAPEDVGFLTLRAGGTAGAPTTSTVNFAAGSVEPNAATVDLSADGKLQVWVFMPSATAAANVLIDIVGYTIDHVHDDRYYTKEQIDTGTALINADIAKKADISTVYNKGETYSRAEIDAKDATKADAADTYSISEVDGLLGEPYGIAINGSAFVGGAGVDVVRTGGGCAYNSTNLGSLRASVQMPLGATVTDVKASVIDAAAVGGAVVDVTVGGASNTLVGLAATAPSFDDGFTFVDGSVTSEIPITSGNWVYLTFNAGTQDGSIQVCSVELTIQP